MHYNKKLLYIIFLSLVFTQSQFNYYFPDNIEFSDARSMSIGNMHLTLGSNSAVTSINPARLAYISKDNTTNTIVDFQLMSSSYQERRSQVILDNWEEHLNYSDYVVNQHSNFYNSFGLISNFGNFGFGLSKKPIKSLNYTYEEEVRSERDYPDGYIGMKDPIMGYHIYESRGTLYLKSFGLGYGINVPSLSKKNKLAIGFSYNLIEKENLYIEQYIDTLYQTFDPYFDDNFDSYSQYTIHQSFPRSYHRTVSLETPIKDNIIIIMAYEDNKHALFNIKKSIGIVIESQKSILMSFECNSQDDLEEYKIGFEYGKQGGMPFRMGLNWKEMPVLINTFVDDNPIPLNVMILNPVSTLTLGTGKKIKDMNFDIGINYKIMQNNNITNPFFDSIDDKVVENQLNLLMTMTWRF